MRTATKWARAVLAAVGVSVAGCVDTPPSELPKQLAWSAYDVGSGGYNQSVAIGNAFKQKYNVSLRVLPGKNDISRLLPLRAGRVQFSANGVGASYYAQEGVYEFGAPAWGPQLVRALMLNTSNQILTVVAAGDAGIKTLADLKGKRVAWVIGSPAINHNVTAMLAFGGLTWNDVKKVEFGGFVATMDGIINNQVDAAFTTSVSGKSYQVAKSPRGLVYPRIPHDDKEGWKRLRDVAPFFFPFMGTEGAQLSEDNPAESAAYPYPILMTYDKQNSDLVYKVTKAMVDTFDTYKDAAPGNSGWDPKRQSLAWVIPFHDGAIRYWKEAGMWKAEHQAHNDKLIERQKLLTATWAKVKEQSHANDEAFTKAWMKARVNALIAAGFDPVLKSW